MLHCPALSSGGASRRPVGSILTAIYHMLKSGAPLRDLGADYFDRRSPEAKAKRLVTQLTKLGFDVKLQPLAVAA